MKLVYLPDSGLYLNPAHILFVKKHYEGTDQYSIKFVTGHANLIISECDFFVLANMEF